MTTKFPPGQDMDNISPKDLEEAKQYTKERKAYKDASQIGSDRGAGDVTHIFKPMIERMRAAKNERKAASADRASRVNAMGDTYKKGGMTASARADGCAVKGKTKGRFV